MFALNQLIHDCHFGKEICTLCFTTVPAVSKYFKLQDEAVLNDKTVALSEILLLVLGRSILYNLLSEIICQSCTDSLVVCYTFIKKCKENADQLNNTVKSLLGNLQPHLSAQTLFIYFNQSDFTLKQYHSNEKCTPGSAVTTFNSLITCADSQIANEEQMKFLFQQESQVTKKVPKATTKNIKTCDMMTEPNNCSRFKCKLCLRTFARSYNLRAHFIRIHAPKKYRCVICEKKFGSNFLLKQHNTENHKEIVCSECGKSFTNLPTLREHELSHKQKFVCSDCGRVYKRKVTFQKHKEMNVCGNKSRQSNANAEFVCDICSKRYCLKSSLRVHIQFEHGNGKVHLCTWCNKKFSAQSLLKAHIVTHTHEKNYHCEVCFGKFVSKESLRYHTRIHSGERPYECGECECRFLSASRRIEHVKKYHQNSETCKLCFPSSLSKEN